ncbi:MAG: trigger factor [Eubacteriales bacterium]|nr:trigger factor [Eubacteriales bacterium]MDD3350402.1 trigger factor [Eubacteriales bacterium]
MKFTYIGREKNEVTFKMDVTAEDFAEALAKGYASGKGKYVVDGFRKGKAPRKLIEAKYGEDVFYEDAINQLFSENYSKALDELNIDPVDRPVVDFGDIDAAKGFEVTVKVTAMPIIEVKDYKGIKVAKIEIPVTDEDVEKDLEALQKRNSRMVLVERPAANGDTVLIDYAGFVGDLQFDGGTAERQPLTLGSNTFIPGFEEQLVGASVGEERDVKVTFPEEYHSDELAGKEAIFKCKVHEIKETELPALDDDFAKDVSVFDTIDELKKDTREKLEKAAAEKAEYNIKNSILEKVYEATEVDVPDVLIEEQIDEMLKEFDQQLRYQGMELEKYFEFLGKDVTEFRAEVRPDALKKVKTRLVVEAVADAENFTVTEEDMDKEMAAMADQYKMELEKLRGMMSLEGITYLAKDIKNRKAIDLMFESAVIE